MNKVILALIIPLSLWPFHHKPAFTVTPDGCDAGGNLYFYTGDDKMTGISGASCEAAKDNWRKLHIDPVRMSRS